MDASCSSVPLAPRSTSTIFLALSQAPPAFALFGLYQAIFMANAGGAWDNAKKIVEVDLAAKGTELHDASIVGDTVGDPFKDTSSVSMNPVIKFTTLFGLLAVELAVSIADQSGHTITLLLSAMFFALSVFFVYRSFFGMRINRTMADVKSALDAEAALALEASGDAGVASTVTAADKVLDAAEA